MKELKFTCKAEIEEYDEVYDENVEIVINFYKKNKKDNFYLMDIGIGEFSINFFNPKFVKNPYQVLCEHFGYNEIHLKNHLVKHYQCVFKWNKIYVPEIELNNLINKLESFQIMDKLLE